MDNDGETYIAWSFQWDFSGGGTLLLNGMQSTWAPVDTELVITLGDGDELDDANS